MKLKGRAKCIPKDRDAIFLPYQAKWIMDESRLKLGEKSRQIGFTWCTAYATVASGANVIKDSAGVDTGLRFDLTTTPNFGATDSAYHDFKVGGSTKYLKTTAATWTAL